VIHPMHDTGKGISLDKVMPVWDDSRGDRDRHHRTFDPSETNRLYQFRAPMMHS
jgi:hypothetical protein